MPDHQPVHMMRRGRFALNGSPFLHILLSCIIVLTGAHLFSLQASADSTSTLRGKSTREKPEVLQALEGDLRTSETPTTPSAEVDSVASPSSPTTIGIATHPGSAIRWSGLGLTEAQHEVVNDAIASFFTDPARARQWLLNDQQYHELDPEGLLRANHVRIYVFEGLLDRIRDLARQRGLE